MRNLTNILYIYFIFKFFMNLSILNKSGVVSIGVSQQANDRNVWIIVRSEKWGWKTDGETCGC